MKKVNGKLILLIVFLAIFVVGLVFKAVYVQNELGYYLINFGNLQEHEIVIKIIILNCITILGAVIIVSNKKITTVAVVVSLVFSLLFFGDLVYMRYYHTPLPFSAWKQAKYIKDINSSVLTLIKQKDILLFVDVFVLFVISLFLRKYKYKINEMVQVTVGFLIVYVSLSISNGMYAEFDKADYFFDSKLIARDMGILTYHANDVFSKNSTPIDVGGMTAEKIEKINSKNVANSSPDNRFYNIGEGMNLIVVQLEAFQNFPINRTYNGQVITPFINSLINNNSVYAENFYYQTYGGNTSDAEILANTSTLPIVYGVNSGEFPTNAYVSLPKMLKDKGYSPNAYHSYIGTFWNRIEVDKNLGFDKLYSIDDFDQNEIVGWALSDEQFFHQSLNFAEEASGDKPFYAFMTTLSSHHPYDAFYNGVDNSLLYRYILAVNYVDKSLQTMYEDLERRGIADNTIIVLYGDHMGIFDEDLVDMAEYLDIPNTTESYLKETEIPFVMHIPNLGESIVIDDIVGQQDIMPTIANVMGLNVPYTMGVDMLNNNNNNGVIKRNGDVITKDFIYLNETKTFYDYDSLEVIEETQEMLDTVKSLQDELVATDYIQYTNYLKNIIKE